jgi:hypothetical protein
VRWLVLQFDEDDTGGWFLFQHGALVEPAKFDSWHETRDQAEAQAARQYGVLSQAWRADTVVEPSASILGTPSDDPKVDRFPDEEIAISSPAQLRAVLREIRQCVTNGTLRPVRLPEASLADDDLSAILDDGPWPDYLEVYFEDRNGTRYRLAVETYHGAGGSWRRA